jgi:hypothetical protein
MRLAASLRYALYAAAVLLLLSGALWLAVRYGTALGPRERRLLAVSMRIHGAATMAMLVLAGCAVALHAPAGWRERRNMTSGTALGGVLLLLTLTGYLLYYVGDDAPRAIASAVHWIAGIAAAAALVWHVAEARRAAAGRTPPD